MRCTALCPLVLFATAAEAVFCPDSSWHRHRSGKCYRAQGHGTHAECAAMCGANASLPHITSQAENDYVSWVAKGAAWTGLYVELDPDDASGRGFWGELWTSGKTAEGFANWARGFPADFCGAANCAAMNLLGDGRWHDAPCAWTPEFETVYGPKPACVCEFPAKTTRAYWDAVPHLEEKCDPAIAAARVRTNIMVVCGLVILDIVRWRRARTKKRKAAEKAHVAPADEEARGDGNETAEGAVSGGRTYLGRRESLTVTHQHCKMLEEKAIDPDADLPIKYWDAAMMMAGVRAPACLRGPCVDVIWPVIARVLAAWFSLAGAENYLSIGGTTNMLMAVLHALSALTFWRTHVAMTSMLAEERAHLLVVIEPIEQDEKAWKALRAKLNPAIALGVSFCLSVMVGLANTAPGAAGPKTFGNPFLGFAFGFVGNAVGLTNFAVLLVTCLRLLTAGHVRLLIDLEQRTTELLRETPPGDRHAFCANFDAAERRAAGAMSVSNEKLSHVIWLTLVLLGMGMFVVFAYINANTGAKSAAIQALVIACAVLLVVWVWALYALLNLLRAVGDALADLIEEMHKAHNCARVAALFEDPSFLAHRFSDRHTARTLTWVLLTDPVTSATMYKAIGGVLVSAAFVFLPGLVAGLA